MKSTGHPLVLIPWHIGNLRDISINAAGAARDIRVFLAEEPDVTKRAFASDLGLDCRQKEFLLIPAKEDKAFLRNVCVKLEAGPVGLICSSGIPCFVDPGSWLVKRLRALGRPITAYAGASVLTTMLSLSGTDWAGDETLCCGTFIIYTEDSPTFRKAIRRKDEPVFVFLATSKVRECLALMEPIVGERPVSAFFDLTKVPKSKFPYADRVLTMNCGEWRKEAESLPWELISDVALMVLPLGR